MQAVADAQRTGKAREWVRTQLAVGDRRIIFVGLLAVSLLLRWWFVDVRGLWFDEAFSATIARESLAGITKFLADHDTHPPLHYFFLHFWMAFFGESETALRSFSILASLVVIACTVLLARRMLGDGAALLAGVLLAVSPLHIAAAQEARMYSLLGALVAGSSYALWLALEDGRRRHWIAYGLLVVGALYTHHFAWLSLGGQIAYVVVCHRSPAVLKAFARTLIFVGLAYAPIVPMLVRQFTTARELPILRPPLTFSALTDAFGLLSFGGHILGMGTYWRRGNLPLELRGPLLVPFLLLVVAGLAGLPHWRKRLFLLSYWLAPMGTIALISPRWNLFYERYFSYVLPPVIILLASGLLYVSNAMRERQRGAALAGLLIFLASFQIPALRLVYKDQSFHGWRPAAHYVTAKVAPNDFLLFIPPFARTPFLYYFRGQQRNDVLNPLEYLNAGERRGPMAVVDPHRLAVLAERHQHLWIIATIPLGYEARMRMNKLLTPYFKEIEGKQFGIVYVFRWESLRYRPDSIP